MSGDFLDSNVVIYMMDERDQRKSDIARSIVTGALDGGGYISFQVVQETLSVLTGKMPRPITAAQASEFLNRILESLWKVMPTPSLYRRALELQDRYNYHFYDSLILAAALWPAA